MPKSGLGSLIRQHREALSQRWFEALSRGPAATTLDREEVIDSLREFCVELAKALDRDSGRRVSAASRESSAIAKGHGQQRFLLGYDLTSVIREYGILRDVIFDFMEEQQLTPSLRELRVLSKYLIAAIADAAEQYGVERDAELQRQAARHLGFLAHELRNPLGSARLTLETLKLRGELGESPATTRLGDSLVRLTRLLDDALIDARLRALPTVTRERLSAAALIREIVRDVAPDAEANDTRFELLLKGPLPVSGDQKLLWSALSNLVRNAVKFTRRGGRIQLRGRTAQGRLVIEVEDECGGLSEETHKSLFLPFSQVGVNRTGHGLGLAIARQAVTAHGGELRVINVPGRGCVFVVDLPQNPTEPKTPNKQSMKRVTRKRSRSS